MTAQTIYPIASTTKALNATLIGMLVARGHLAWDVPVQNYFSRFRLCDPLMSAQVTLRDLVTMRTGLGRHDFVWMADPLTRADLVDRLVHLELSAGFRARFQYNNLTPAIAGHIAETVAGDTWEDLLRRNILEPLGMNHTTMGPPSGGELTERYNENDRRELTLGARCMSVAMAPVGGMVHSTVEDMTKWLLFNLGGEHTSSLAGLDRDTLAQLHAPQVAGGHDPAAPSPGACYALGWWADRYNGHARTSHTGYMPGLSTSVMLFPNERVGLVCFVNLGAARLARLLNEHVFDLLMDQRPEQTLLQKLAQYERAVEENRRRIAAVPRVTGTSPSHSAEAYCGTYVHPGYGAIVIERSGDSLVFRRNWLSIPLEHWHYNVWVVAENEMAEIHQPHPLDRASRLAFESNEEGRIAAVSMRPEPGLAPIRFGRQ
jgi:CubicO group peptidase (beta-lactamase class C family)